MFTTDIIDLKQDFDNGLNYAAALIKNGDLVAFPTETVYGLGANALNPLAVSDIFKVKGRPNDNPLIVHVNSIEFAKEFAYINETAIKLFKAFSPGPLTLVLPKKEITPSCITAGLDTVAIRIPNNKYALELIQRSKKPIAAPSANLSGQPSPTNANHVYKDLNTKIKLILDGGQCSFGVESTVLSLANEPTILRPGSITKEMLEKYISTVNVDKNVLNHLETKKVASPGMKYKHYAPKANATIFDGDYIIQSKKIIEMYDKLISENKKVLIFASEQTKNLYGERNFKIMGNRQEPQTICSSFFALLRQTDDEQYDEILIESIETKGEGLAFMNRALRAASFNVK